MNFLVLLLVALAERFSGLRGVIQQDGWWRELQARPLGGGRPWLRLAWLVLLPLVLCALLLKGLGPLFYGWLALPLHLLLVIYSLGRGDPRQALAPFRSAWDRGDSEAAALIAQRDLGLAAEEPAQLRQQAEAWLLLQGCQGFFSVIFWYVLLGPLAALAYRLLLLCEQQAGDAGVVERAGQLRHAFDWLPARVLVASFALVGHFVVVSRVLVAALSDWNRPTRDLLVEAGGLSIDAPADDGNVSTRLDALWELMLRAGVAWYVVFALWTLLV